MEDEQAQDMTEQRRLGNGVDLETYAGSVDRYLWQDREQMEYRNGQG